MSGKIVGSVRGQVLHLIYPPLVEGTVDYLTAEFSFSGDWEGLSKWAHFKQGSTIYDVPLTNDTITEDQHLNLSAGTWDVYLHGSGDNRRITTTTVRMKVLPYLDEDGEPLPEVPLTFAEVLDQRAQRIQAVAYAVEAGESARKEAERSRELSEFARVQAEAERTGAEAGRASAEAVRASAETARKNAEQDRISAENSRSSAEDTRKTNEEARQAAEAIREQNEEARVEAEKNRKDGITPHIGDNGNWYLGDTDTGKPSRGETGAGMDITGATVDQIAKITAVDDTGKPTAWEAVDMPISFKPAGKSYLTFNSPNSFTLAVNDATKHWDGTLEYFASDKTWTVWDGTTTLSAIADDGEYVLYLRGTGNTIITGSSENYRWVLTGTDIKCIGNIENLLDYANVASGEHPTMANSCYEYMFYGCPSLTQPPDLPATTLAESCYSNMFSGCTSLTQAPDLPATTLMVNCYYFMFRDCTALTQAPALPAMTLENYCYRGMFYNCTSLTQAPALPATTLAAFCYMAMFYGCTSLTQAPVLPATTLENSCYRGMFQGCTSLKLSTTQTGEYTQEYRIPSSGEGVAEPGALISIFASTGGTFTETPTINTTYYLSSDNMVVRETEVATLNGYVGSMIDAAIAEHTSNPLNITGATVGQIAKITAVGENGKPTEWEAADIPSGGGGVALDTTLTQSGKAADAAAVGERISALSEEIVTTSEAKVAAHNTGADTHGDIRLLIQGLTDRLNALADSDDTTLDQLSEVVAYIKSNRSLIEAITTNKVSVADIIDNLTTNVTNKPLSAAQGVALKALIDGIVIPEKLPSPNALTFTGAVTGSYDGSAPVSVEIPSGGGDGNRKWALLSTAEVGGDELAAVLATPTANEMEGYKEMLCIFTSQTKGSDGSEVTSPLSLRPSVVDVPGAGDFSRISGDCGNCVGTTTSARTALIYITTIANYLSGYVTNISASVSSFANVKNSAQVFDKLPQIKMMNSGSKYYCYGTKLEVYVR